MFEEVANLVTSLVLMIGIREDKGNHSGGPPRHG